MGNNNDNDNHVYSTGQTPGLSRVAAAPDAMLSAPVSPPLAPAESETALATRAQAGAGGGCSGSKQGRPMKLGKTEIFTWKESQKISAMQTWGFENKRVSIEKN